MIKKLLLICFAVVIFFNYQIYSKNSNRVIRDGVGNIVSIKNHNGLLETKYFYYESGGMKEKIELQDGEYHGKHVSWYPNGNKEMEIEFKKGILNGKAVVWYKNGKIKMQCEFMNGDHHRKFIEMTKDGKISSMKIYRNGKIRLDFLQEYSNSK